MPCYDCGRRYGESDWVEAIIPDAIWAAISPAGDESGILCIACIARRLTKAGFYNVPVWLCGTEPFQARAGNPEITLLCRAEASDYRHHHQIEEAGDD